MEQKTDRVILHCDMNSFFASVELLSLPELREKPVAVCGNPENRHGIILAKNEHAKKFGVVTAETVWQARKKCPELVLVPPHRDRYEYYCGCLNELYQKYTDLVEPFSIDESWLDVTASLSLFGSGKDIADQIRAAVKKEMGLTLSVGVSFNKIFAKMGSDYRKPDATTVISRENFKKLLWPLPVENMFFVGEATAEKLNRIGIKSIGDLAAADEELLSDLFGKQGRMLSCYANGRDESPVAPASQKREVKSVGNGLTFKRDLRGENEFRMAVLSLSDTVAVRLRRHGLTCGGVKIDIKDPNFRVTSRQKQLSYRTNTAEEISRAAMELLENSWGFEKPVRLLTVTAIQLSAEEKEEQISFLDDGAGRREKAGKAERMMDEIRKRFGSHAITYGGLLNNELGIDIKEKK